MHIYQLLPTISYGDAVSNDTLALQQVIKKMGFKSEIYAESVDIRLPKGTAKSVSKLPKLSEDDVVIYHMSTGAQLNWDFGKMNCKKVMVYHNITPPEYLERYNSRAALQCSEGIRALRYLSDKVDYCLAVSEYNKQDLIELGFKCKIDVLPILIPFSDYDKEPDASLMRRYEADACTNILFTGRLAPNKCQEDVIKSFAEYKKNYNPASRLILVGSDSGYENYRKRLESFAYALEVKDDIIFAGHIKFNQILSYYRMADVFLCMSEHEGFCVPLVEAMYFNIPIIAYDSSAIYGTLGGSGIVLSTKDSLEVAGVIDKVVKDKALRDKLIANEKERLKDFSHEVIEERFISLMKENVL